MKKITRNVYIGDLEDASDPERIVSNNISSVLKLTSSEPRSDYPTEVEVYEHPLIDGPENEYVDFQDAVEKLVELLKNDEKVLVHCAAGVSRSGSVTVTALAKIGDSDYESTLKKVQSRKPNVNPHPHLREQGRRFLDEI